MVSRRRAREAALQALYQCDTLAQWTKEAVDLYFELYCNSSPDAATAEIDTPACAKGVEKAARHKELEQENLRFARSLIMGVIENLDFIDRQIAAASTNWSVARMARVDRNILRVACYEMAFAADIPVNVSINEAIEIAKTYGTEDSPMFVNGVLDNIAKAFESNPALNPAARERQRRKNIRA